MKKNLLILMTLMLWASPVVAQQTGGATPPAPAPERLEVLEVEAILGYWSVTNGGNPRVARYDYLKSSVAGGLNVEWDPLPHRFLFESFAVNRKDYFGSMDYAYRDVVVFNVYSRGLYHNLNHVSLGLDNPITASPSFVDRNPGAAYAVESTLRKAFLRLKTPDFPFHVYVEAQTFDRAGTIQQRFMLDPGSINKFSQSREIDWHTQEVKVGINSHLGFLEADLSHTEKTFTARKDKTLFDDFPATTVSFMHNLTPDLSSSTDTIKVHTTYSGRVVASGTYSGGDKKNDFYDGTKTDFKNLAGDITYTPIHYLVFVLKYRQFELDAENSATSTAPTVNGTAVYNVRDALSSKRDVLTGLVKYRMSPRLTFKAEYSIDTTEREKFFDNAAIPLHILPVQPGVLDNSWDVARSTTKTTTKAGLTYRITNNFFLRTDYSAAQVDNPAYASDADKINSLKASATWKPFQWLSTLVSYGGIREERSNISAPLAGGSRKTNRDQTLGSLTFLLGKRSSVTVSYAEYQNKNRETLTYQMSAPFPPLVTEDGVLISTDSQVTSVGLTHALSDGVHVSAEASRCRSKDKFRNAASGSSTQTANDVLADTSIIEDVLTAGIEMQLARNLSIDGRYQYANLDDQTDNTQDGWVRTVMATLSLKW